ncbi:MAG: fibronectin type 3 domain-containing protein [Paraglaciecola sp.]|jgi:fibronectin type 3 domain-containing protein
MGQVNRRLYCSRVKYLLIYLPLLVHGNLWAEQHSVAVFQFTAGSFSAVGIEKELVYTVRNELRKQPNILLINQRVMEVELSRNEIVQAFDSALAISAGQVLAVNYVVLGKVDRNASHIEANLQLVSTASQSILGDWVYRYRNKQEIASRASELGTAIATKIAEHQVGIQISGSQNTVVWLNTFNAQAQNNRVLLTWSPLDSAPEALGYNIYRSKTQEGPFSYLSSVLDPTYTDNAGDADGTLYYQFAMLTSEGDELRSNKMVSASIEQEIEADLDAPTVVRFTPFVKGAEVEFIAAAENSDKKIDGYQLIRRSSGGPWLQAGFKSIDQPTNNRNSNKESKVTRHVMRDVAPTMLTGNFEYAVRAIKGLERGKLSEIYPYHASLAPNFENNNQLMVRKIKLTWNPVQNGSGYVVYRRQNGTDAPWQKLATLPTVQQLSYIDEDIAEDGQKFDYAISIFDKFSESQKSAPITLISRGALPAPEQPQAISGLVKGVALSWKILAGDKDVMGYSIFRTEFSESSDIRLLKIAEVTDPNTSEYFDNNELQDGKSYYYAIAALNTFNVSGELSKVVKVMTKPAPAPVNNLQTQALENTITVQWQYNIDQEISGYQIKRRWQGHSWHVLAELPADAMQFIDSDLMAGANVEYQVTVLDKDKLTSEPRISPSTMSLVSLNLLKPTDGLLRRVELNWETSPHLDAVYLLRANEQQEWRRIAKMAGSEVKYMDKEGLLDDVEYRYKIQSVYNQNIITESNVVTVKTKDIPAPSSLQALGQVARQIELIWPTLNDESIKSYVIFRRKLNETNNQSEPIGEVLNQSIGQFINTIDDSTPIQHGIKYAYSIASRNVYDVMGPRSEEVITASKPLPAKASNVSAKATEDTINISWKAGSENDLQSVSLFRKWQHQSQWQKLVSLLPNITHYADKNLLPYATASYQIRFTDADGLNSELSEQVTSLSPLSTLLQVENEGLLRRNDLTWKQNDLIKNFQLMRSTNQTDWRLISESSNSSFSDRKNLIDQTLYYYQVKVIDNQKVLGMSNTVQATTKALPLAPANINLISNEVKKVTISWSLNDDQDIGGYILYRSEKEGEFKKLDTVKPNITVYEDDGGFFSKLEHGTQYSYSVSSFNTYKVEGPKSPIYFADTKSLPTKVMGLEGKLLGSQATFKWQNNSEVDIQEYWVYRSRGCNTLRKLLTLSSTTTNFTDSDVDPGRTYCYRVSAVDIDELEGDYSDVVKITVPKQEASE